MKKITSYALLLSSILWMGSCSNANKSGSGTGTGDSTAQGASASLKPLTNETSSNQFHLYFDITKSSETDSSIVYEAKSEFKTEPVGFNVEVLKNIPPGIDESGQADEDLGFKKGAIRISSNGAPSDNFVKSLGTLFNLPTDGKMASGKLEPLVFSSNKQKVDLTQPGTYSFKYFFSNATGKDAELFGTLDIYKHSFELGEKDSTFRAAIISAFEGK